MSKLSRYTQKLFGSTAGSTQIGQYGSLAAGSPAYTNNPATIQALSNYLQGWFGAVLGGNSPAIEDLNAIDYLYSYQLGYIFQEGIPEYDSATTYYTNSLCLGSTGIIYQSTIDNNTGHTPSGSSSQWVAYKQPTVTPNIITYTATGSHTYTPSANVKYAKISGIGGGGGGGGTTTSGSAFGVAGSATIFSDSTNGSYFVLNGGAFGRGASTGSVANQSGGSGGTVIANTFGSTNVFLVSVAGGGGTGGRSTSGSQAASGGPGGDGFYGGSGGGGFGASAGMSATLNSGGGGGGAGADGATGMFAGGGGGSGGYASMILYAPVGPYTIVLGAGGAGGTGNQSNGGGGASGYVVIEEYFS